MTRSLDRVAERADDDNPEWTRAMMRKARSAAEVLPSVIGEPATAELMSRGRGRPVTGLERKAETFRLPQDVTQAYKATGNGWRDLIVKTLRDHAPKA